MNTSMSAADAAALFDGARLTLARQLAGQRKSDLAATIQKSPTAVAAWESGNKRPSPSTVAELALGLGIEPAFFAVAQEDVTTLTSPPHFRSLRSTTQLARDQAQAYGQLAVDIATGLERHVEFPEVRIPRIPVDVDDIQNDGPEEAARLVRESWELGLGPAGHLVRQLEKHGVLVVFSPPQAAAVDAYSFDSRVRPVVVLNPLKRDYYRQRFDVAHELGHLVMHTDAEPGGRIVEEQAHRFAAELLMPAEEIASLLPRSINSSTWVSLAKLKEQCGVSMQALLFRARQLGVLGDVSYRNAMTTVSVRGWRRAEPGQVQVLEQPSLLPRAIELLDNEGLDDRILAMQCRVPLDLFHAATSRIPSGVAGARQVRITAQDRRRVVSLLSGPEGPETEIGR
jgi:Zn-dependent peptidase ImmA (M78 family)/DNA-binding XRE family transcriptional regulator